LNSSGVVVAERRIADEHVGHVRGIGTSHQRQ
jgi:hypothetical protein